MVGATQKTRQAHAAEQCKPVDGARRGAGIKKVSAPNVETRWCAPASPAKRAEPARMQAKPNEPPIPGEPPIKARKLADDAARAAPAKSDADKGAKVSAAIGLNAGTEAGAAIYDTNAGVPTGGAKPGVKLPVTGTAALSFKTHEGATVSVSALATVEGQTNQTNLQAQGNAEAGYQNNDGAKLTVKGTVHQGALGVPGTATGVKPDGPLWGRVTGIAGFGTQAGPVRLTVEGEGGHNWSSQDSTKWVTREMLKAEAPVGPVVTYARAEITTGVFAHHDTGKPERTDIGADGRVGVRIPVGPVTIDLYAGGREVHSTIPTKEVPLGPYGGGSIELTKDIPLISGKRP